MAVAANMKYDGKVLAGAQLITSSKQGTLGFEVPLECVDGRIKHVIWLTAATMERAEKTFNEALGVSRAQLQDEEFVAKKLAEYITGRDVRFETEADDQGYVKVKWLNGTGSMGKPAQPKMLSDFFKHPAPPASAPASWGAAPAQQHPATSTWGGQHPRKDVIDDSKIPF